MKIVLSKYLFNKWDFKVWEIVFKLNDRVFSITRTRGPFTALEINLIAAFATTAIFILHVVIGFNQLLVP